ALEATAGRQVRSDRSDTEVRARKQGRARRCSRATARSALTRGSERPGGPKWSRIRRRTCSAGKVACTAERSTRAPQLTEAIVFRRSALQCSGAGTPEFLRSLSWRKSRASEGPSSHPLGAHGQGLAAVGGADALAAAGRDARSDPGTDARGARARS